MAIKMNLTIIIIKNHAVDQEIGFVVKSISKSNCCATAMPIAWELTYEIKYLESFLLAQQRNNLQKELRKHHVLFGAWTDKQT